MAVSKINKQKYYSFIEAWEKSLKNESVVITSEISKDSYRNEIKNKKRKLKFYNPIICGWQPCAYIIPSEMFGRWFISENTK